MQGQGAIPEQFPRVLVVRVGAMGDVLHALPAVTALRHALPGSFLGWAIDPRWQALLQSGPTAAGGHGSPERPVVDQVHPVPTRLWKRQPWSPRTAHSILALRRELRAGRYDLCVDLQGSIRSAAVGRLAAARRFCGSDAPRERAARLFYGERAATRAVHVIDQASELLGAAMGLTLSPLPPALPTAHDAVAWTAKLLADDRSFVLLAPTAGWGAKQWPAERFAALARSLVTAGMRVLVNASSPDDPISLAVARTGHAELTVSSLQQLIELTRRAAVVVGGDTGPVHLAAALGRPVVALFGPTDPARNGPAGFPESTVTTLRSEGSRTTYARRAEPDPGLLHIAVPEVLQAVLAALPRACRQPVQEATPA